MIIKNNNTGHQGMAFYRFPHRTANQRVTDILYCFSIGCYYYYYMRFNIGILSYYFNNSSLEIID